MVYKVNVLVDWGKSFVDEDGSFYCGTTADHKEKAVRVIETNPDLVVFFSDTHPANSPEFIANGGMYPAHNMVRRDWNKAQSLGVAAGKVVSPELTQSLQDALKGRTSGIIVPRHVFFQTYNGEPIEKVSPCYALQDVIDTYNVPLLNPADFLAGKVNYVIQAKEMFDGSESKPTAWMGQYSGVPTEEMNVCSLLQQKFGQGRGLQFDLTGVVTGICIAQTAEGLRRKFKFATINVISDATKQLTIEALGIPNDAVGNDVARRRLAQTGINYLTVEEYLKGQ